MRLFIAYDIDRKFRKECEYTILKGMKIYRSEIKWVKVENLHFTLLFLGDVLYEDLDIVKLYLDEFATKLYVLHLKNGQLRWDKLHKPRTIWIEYTLDNKEIMELRNNFASKLQKILPYLKINVKDFRFHLTLGRVQKELNIDRWLLHEEVINTTSTLENISLYESILSPSGRVYKNLLSYKLQGDNHG